MTGNSAEAAFEGVPGPRGAAKLFRMDLKSSLELEVNQARHGP
jgi:hypothetical protein